MCDRHDIGLSVDGGSLERSPRVGGAAAALERIANEPKIFIYDNYPGGVGFSEPLYRMHGDLIARTRDLVATCPCEAGCPSCVGPIGETGPLAKTVALRLADLLLDRTAEPSGPPVAGPACSTG
jgi:DEAD/DEAH box helicase domain-containing protein